MLLVAAGGTFREVWSKSPTHIHTFHVIGVIVQAFACLIAKGVGFSQYYNRVPTDLESQGI